MPLSPQRRPSPLFEGLRLIVLIDSFIQGRRKSPGEHVDGLGAVDVILGVSYEFLEMSNVPIKILPLHPDSLPKSHARLLLLKGVSELSVKREEATVP